MRKQEVAIDGIDYVVTEFKYGIDADITAESVGADVSDSGKITPMIDTKKLQLNTLLNALKSWTFRGYDEDDEFKREGEILPITSENIRELPSSHGLALNKMATELNKVGEVERKN